MPTTANFRFVDKEETIAVSGHDIFNDNGFVKDIENLKYSIFHVSAHPVITNMRGISATPLSQDFHYFFSETRGKDAERGVFELIEKIDREIKNGKKVVIICKAGCSQALL